MKGCPSPTAIILHAMLADPDTKTTVAEWLADDLDLEERAVQFAGQLRDDFEKVFRGPGLENRLLEAVLQYVNWRRLAEELLARFKPRRVWPYLCNTSIN